MRVCRFDGGRRGLVEGGRVFDITGEGAEEALVPVPPADWRSRPSRPIGEVRLLSPVRAPGKIIAAPVNYKAHIEEMKASNASPGHNIWDIEKSGLFLKASSSLVGPSEGIAQRFLERRTDFEVELVAVIGRRASAVEEREALSCVAGYALGIDVTVRGTEDRSFRKSMDSYTVLGPWLTTADEVPDPQRVQLAIEQNGVLRQDTNTADMLWSLAKLIAFGSRFYTLEPGDLLFTGTPSGVGPIRPGDRLRAYSDCLGEMRVDVRAWEP